MRLLDLVDATQSYQDDEFINTMNLSAVRIYRRNPNNAKPIEIITDIEKNIYLNKDDHITIPRIDVNQVIKSVIISGEVNTPGIAIKWRN